MRPVDRGGQGTYPQNVDLTSQQTLNNSLDHITVTYLNQAAPKAQKLWGTSSPTASQVLRALYRLLFWDPSAPPPAKKQKGVPADADVSAVKETLTNKLADLYGAAAAPLEDNMGRFCSFCETYVTGVLAVEHIVPKAPYPFFYLAWENFLLGCTMCNSNKLSKPPRSDPLFTPKPTEELGYYTTILNSYLWPHHYNNVYRSLTPQLQYHNGTTWKKVGYPVADGTIRTSKTVATRVIRGDVLVSTGQGTGQAWRLNVPVRVWLVPNTPRATRLVDMLGLNKDSTRTDLRVWDRTLHWFKVVAALQKLRNAGDFDDAWEMMMGQVQQPGLYTNWVAAIDAMGPGGSWLVPGGGGQTVMARFLAEIVGEDYFPGTDTANTP